MDNGKIKHKLSGALSRFFNLVSILLIEDSKLPENTPENREKYALLIQQEAEKYRELKPKIRELLNQIK